MGSRMQNPCSAPWKAPPAPPLLPLPQRTCALRSREATRPGKGLGQGSGQGGRMGGKSGSCLLPPCPRRSPQPSPPHISTAPTSALSVLHWAKSGRPINAWSHPGVGRPLWSSRRKPWAGHWHVGNIWGITELSRDIPVPHPQVILTQVPALNPNVSLSRPQSVFNFCCPQPPCPTPCPSPRDLLEHSLGLRNRGRRRPCDPSGSSGSSSARGLAGR